MRFKNNDPSVAFLGNINNNFFSLARYLRDLGLNCSLLRFGNEKSHFHPSCDTYTEDYSAWVDQLEWGNRKYFGKFSSSELCRSLKNYDFLVGCGIAPAFCHKAGLSLNVFVPHGNDIRGHVKHDFYNYGLMLIKKMSIAKNLFEATRAQQAGIAACPVIHMAPSTELHERNIGRLNPHHTRWREYIPMVYAPEYSREKVIKATDESQYISLVQRIRESCKFMVVCHARHEWGSRSVAVNKGIDILLDGWKIFLEMNPHKTAKLIFFNYGREIGNTKRYIDILGLQKSIEWMPMMSRKEIMRILIMSDAIADQFIRKSAGGNGVFCEALVAQKPLITKVDLTSLNRSLIYDHESNVNVRTPACQASNPNEVAAHLDFLSNNPDKAIRIGKAGFNWYSDMVVEPTLKRYVGLFSRP